MRPSFGSFTALLAIALGSGVPLAPAGLGSQEPARTRTASAWSVAGDPFADLWFHSLAVIGYEGYGPLSMYDSRYAARVHDAKVRGHVTTTLDRRAAELRTVLAADSAFEVLHFLPLYFVGQAPSVVLSALRAAIVDGSRASSTTSLMPAASVIAAALPTRQERAAFTSLLDAVDDEWTTFMRADRSSRLAEDRRIMRELQSAWDDRYAGALGGYLSAIDVRRGSILISPAIGTEGRIVRDRSGAVIVVVSPVGAVGGENAALLRVVRELAFPLLDQLRTPLVPPTTRVTAARARDAAAVRAGAIILDAVDQPLAAEYRKVFLDATRGRGFENAFPLSNEADIELRRLVTSANRGAVSGRTSYENY